MSGVYLFKHFRRNVVSSLVQSRHIDKSHSGCIQIPGDIHTLKNMVSLVISNSDDNDLFLGLDSQGQDSQSFPDALTPGIVDRRPGGSCFLGRRYYLVSDTTLDNTGDQADIGQDGYFTLTHVVVIPTSTGAVFTASCS